MGTNDGSENTATSETNSDNPETTNDNESNSDEEIEITIKNTKAF